MNRIDRARRTALATAAALLACATAAPLAATSSRTIVLVRHGHYAADPKADLRLGPGLTPLGVAQARLTGARLAGLPFRFDAFLASPLTRARETAQVIAEQLPGPSLVIEPALAECTPPTWRKDAVADVPKAEQKACAAELDRFFAAHFVPAPGATAQHELYVCHGNVIRYLVTKALHVDTRAWLEMSVHHASLTTILVEPDGRMKVIAVGDSGHLPPDEQTGATGDPEREPAVAMP